MISHDLHIILVSSEAAAVWQLSADDLGDGDILDSDTLLDEKDLKKPAPEELKGH